MQDAFTPTALARLKLTRADMLGREAELARRLKANIPFSGYSLAFPLRSGDGPVPGDDLPGYLTDEGRMLIPLKHQQCSLGLFVAKGLDAAAFDLPRALVARLAEQALEAMWLSKLTLADPETGLMDRHGFLAAVGREIELVQACLAPDAVLTPGPPCGPEDSTGSPDGIAAAPAGISSAGGFSGRAGLVVIGLGHFARLAARHGHAAALTAIQAVAGALAEATPRTTTLGRLSEDQFGVLWPDATPKACRQLAETLCAAVNGLEIDVPHTQARIRPAANAGLATYPADLSGAQLRGRPADAALHLLAAARKALDTARALGPGRGVAFGRILDDGGLVLEPLPMNRVCVNLGMSAGARVGMRFLVRDPDSGDASRSHMARYAAEIVLSQVDEDVAVADVLHVADPARPPTPGQRLVRAEDAAPLPGADDTAAGPAHKDPLTGLYAYADFEAAWTRAARETERFILAVARVDEGDVEDLEPAVRELAGLAREALGTQLDAEALAGRYGVAGLCWFLPSANPEDAHARFAALAETVRERLGLAVAVGLAAHPYLNFAKAHAPENCRKALDHALMLPAPQVALFDSVSLNVSADRHFARGDLYAAVEEYRLALLADEDNLLAANSLGVCYARLGRAAQALPLFERVAKAEPDNLMAHYNHGSICLRLGDMARAEADFTRCLKLDPEHGFSLVRLGQLAEERGDAETARGLFARALESAPGPAGAARHLARLELAAGNGEAARELLHTALTANPHDAAALALLAGLYLDAGQDPEVAESLARQCTAIAPHKKTYWALLARALDAGGRTEEAEAVRRDHASSPAPDRHEPTAEEN